MDIPEFLTQGLISSYSVLFLLIEIHRKILEVKLRLNFLHLWHWLGLAERESKQVWQLPVTVNPHQSYKLKKSSSRLTFKSILQTLKCASVDCRHIRLA